jgi:mersacidin/lichenicidin family type 2 lantibiotic
MEEIRTAKRRRTTMNAIDVVRAWKDEEYRASLSEEERKLLPEHPAGSVGVSAGRVLPALITIMLPITYQTALTSTYIDKVLGAITVTLR